jgi:hypothetical protein
METARFSEMLVSANESTWHHNPEQQEVGLRPQGEHLRNIKKITDDRLLQQCAV